MKIGFILLLFTLQINSRPYNTYNLKVDYSSDSILSLTQENYLKTINTYDYLAIFFYKNHCINFTECHYQLSQFTNACHKLFDLHLPKIDHHIFCSKFNISNLPINSSLLQKSFYIHDPTIVLFIRGTPIYYTHYHEEENIYNWLYYKSLNYIKDFESGDTIEMIKEIQDSNHATVIYSGRKNTRVFNLFEGLSSELH